MIVSFELSMPGCNSWNGRWSGERDFYCIVRTFPRKREDQLPFKLGYYSYDFGDGWRAAVTVREVDSSSTARALRRTSKGFCGYDWMVNSIIAHGDILTERQIRDRKKIEREQAAEITKGAGI